MKDNKAVAVVGVGAILPDAFDVPSFWENLQQKKYSIQQVPQERWNQELYFNPDPSVPDKTYSKIGAWVRGYQFDPFKSGIAIPPKVLAVMDQAQQWAIAACKQALDDYGYPKRLLDPERVAVILGNAMAGENHYRSSLRIAAWEYIAALESVPEFQGLPAELKQALALGMRNNIYSNIPGITEDTMPGELSNIIAGRVANVFNFSGPNFVTDAACASSLAALESAVEGLLSYKFDAVLSGGVDRNMGPETFVKFSKIGALSADGSRPYADGANGFVMGEGAVILLLKRLEDAEAQGDKIYGVIRGIGGSSDGKGKGITAPNPIGQQRAIERAWKDAGVSPETAMLIEGHGTSTKVGDLTEVNSLAAVFGNYGLANGSIALGSVKSNIGHLKSAAGAAGVLKVLLGLYHKTLPPSVNFEKPNPNIDFANIPFRVNSQVRPWDVKPGQVRRAGVSSFGFGGTNFHVVVEEYLPGMLKAEKIYMPATLESSAASTFIKTETAPTQTVTTTAAVATMPQMDVSEIQQYVLGAVSEKTGYPPEMLDMELDLEADLGIDTVKQAELFAGIRTHYGIPRKEDLRLSDYNTLTKVVGFVSSNLSGSSASPSAAVETTSTPEVQPVVQKNTENAEPKPYQGLFFVSANTLDELKDLLQKQLDQIKSGRVVDSRCPTSEETSRLERLAIDYEDTAELQKRVEKALSALDSPNANVWAALQAQGIYRGSGKPGKVAFLFPGQGSQYVNMLRDLRDAEPVVAETFREADEVMSPILGKPLTDYIYVEGDDASIAQAEKDLKNTAITQPAMLTANVAILRLMSKFGFTPDMVIGHSLGEYAALVSAGVMTFPEALQVVSARGREMSKVSMEDNGCMAAVSAPLEKVTEILQTVDGYVVIANMNSPVQCVIGGSTTAVDAAITAFQTAGFQAVKIPVSHAFHTKIVAPASGPMMSVIARMNVQPPRLPIIANVTGEVYPNTRDEIIQILGDQVASPVQFVKGMATLYQNGARVFVEIGPKRVLNSLASDNLKTTSDVTILATNHPRKGGKASFNEALCGLYAAGVGGQSVDLHVQPATIQPVEHSASRELPTDGRLPLTGSVVVTGAGLGLPGKTHHVFDDANVQSLLTGENRIESLSDEARQGMVEKRVTRLVKSEAGAIMEEITDVNQTLKLAGQRGSFNLVEDFGVPLERVESLDISTQLAIAAGIEALRDAGIPLVMNYRKTSKGTLLPDRWKLPSAIQDETGVVFCSAFPGLDRMAEESTRFAEHQSLTRQLEEINSLQDVIHQMNPSGQTQLDNELNRRKIDIENQIAKLDYHFDRRYVFRILSMGHSQFAEYIGAKGPNTHVNAACATTTHGVAIAEDWIRAGRCRRVIVIAGDDVTNPNLVPWIGTSLFASGAATTEGNLRMAALPFDKRRNGMLMGMGAAALVIESEDAARERGVRAIAEILSTQIANSAFHGTRLDVTHVGEVMDRLVQVAEARFGIARGEVAGKTVFVSHETYTPARGGSASAEIHALRSVFGPHADQVVIANTKGYTGHTMGVGIEDVLAVKALQLSMVPPIAHIHDGFEPDPDLGNLNLSRGGKYPVEYALRLGAGFGSQIAMTLYRKVPGEGERINQAVYQGWLAAVAGYNQAELETVQRTLRVVNHGFPTREPVVSNWQYGQGPALWADQPGNVVRQQASQPVVIPAAVTVSAAVQTPASTQPVAQPSGQVDEIRDYVLSVVSEKTGYPSEMLDLELDLEADLGIDTVKQAELFATIRTHYGIPRKEDLRLSDYNTLTRVIGFVQSNLNSASPAAVPTEAKQPQPESQPIPVMDAKLATNAAAADTDEIQKYVLSAVSEKTGYPVEMLDLELDLEADLGIDTVKQAELFASIRTNYGIPRKEDLRLSDYNTLTKVIGFVVENLKPVQLAPEAEQEVAEPAPSLTEVAADAAIPSNIGGADAADSETDPTAKSEVITPRLVSPVIRPKLDLCVPSPITSLQGMRVLIVRDAAKTVDAFAQKVQSEGANTLVTTPETAGQDARQWLESGRIDGIYYLAGLDNHPEYKTLNPEDSQQVIDRILLPFATLLQTVVDTSFVICATRMGGLHGVLGSVHNPFNGMLSGFAKSIARERDGLFVKVVDFEKKASAASVSTRLLEETFRDPGVVEVGYEGELRYTPAVTHIAPAVIPSPLKQGSVFVITGGSGGIIAPIVLDLARATKGTFFLLSRTKLPAASDPNLQLLKTDRAALRIKMMEKLASSNQKATPAAAEQMIAALERSAATLDLIEDVKRIGGQVNYVSCDINSAEDVKNTCDQIVKQVKNVDVLIHAAGMEKSRKLESKSLDEIQQIVSVKVNGFTHIFKQLNEIGRKPEAVVFFSSVAGRYGNSGQTDYAAANNTLSKLAAVLPEQYPNTRAVSIDWGAWSDVGMASRGNIPQLMKMAGIDMMHPDQAAPLVRQLLEAGASGEYICAGALGQMSSHSLANCGVDVEKSDTALRAGTPIHSMLSHLASYDNEQGISLEATLDPTQHAFLYDHALNGVPVLPGVMGIEGFAVAAKHVSSVLTASKSELEVAELEDIHFLAPFKFYRNQPRKITWRAQGIREADGLKVYVYLESFLELRSRTPEHMLHFYGKVHLTQKKVKTARKEKPVVWNNSDMVCAEDIYRIYFHGPSFQVLDCVQRSGEQVVGKLRANLLPINADANNAVSTPMLVELCFQTAGLWEAGNTGILALPSSIESLTIYDREHNGGQIYAEVRPVEQDGQKGFNARVVDEKGNVFLELVNYRTAPLPYSMDAQLMEPLKVLMNEN